MKKNPYIGKIRNTGSQSVKVKAPEGGGGKSVKGKDLRCGK